MRVKKAYDSVMGRSRSIMMKSLGLDYDEFESDSIAFNYEALINSTGYTITDICHIQEKTGVGNTPLLELRNITELARKFAPSCYQYIVLDGVQ